jgi:glycogen synthase
MPSNAPAFTIVSRCDPISKRGALGMVAGSTPRKLPAASTRTFIPAARIQSPTSE